MVQLPSQGPIPVPTATLVCQHSSRDSVEPWELAVARGHIVETAPGHQERFGSAIAGRGGVGAAKEVRQNMALVSLVHLLKPLFAAVHRLPRRCSQRSCVRFPPYVRDVLRDRGQRTSLDEEVRNN